MQTVLLSTAGMFLAALFAVVAHGADQGSAGPFEAGAGFAPKGPLDERVLAVLRERGIEPARHCSDPVFVRRVFLDAIGTLPTVAEVRAFQKDGRPDKRAALIDDLLTRETFADYWALKWCDLLRVKAEYPINLWPNGVQAYHRWIRDAIRRNQPYDRFVHELLTSSGSNFRVPAVNFYRAMQGREPSTIAAAVALTFMGVRLEGWPASRRADMQVFFARVACKSTGEWKEQIVHLDPAPADPVHAVFPDGSTVRIGAETDPRRVFADWLVAPRNAWFARNIVNRLWSWLFGRGIVHEPDDIRPDNPPSNAGLLAYLASEMVSADYDMRHMYRLILNSATYQQSPIPRSDHPDVTALFGHYPVRRLDAEVLIDALCRVGGAGETYASAIPEPFTFIPARQRSITLADGSISSPFLEMFGRPSRDTGLESERDNRPTAAQSLHLLNSSHVRDKIRRSPWLRRLVRSAGGNRRALIRRLYLGLLSRVPTPQELATAVKYCDRERAASRQAAEDVAWALMNSKEFLFRH